MNTKIKCPVCGKEIEAYTEGQANQQMKMHKIFKHPKII
jgi:ribosomal protein S27E